MAKIKRPSWDEFWFLMAMVYSTRGTCDRLRAGCVIVKDKKLVGAGYNGSPRGLPHCDEAGHLIINGHCERTLHAEENAVLNTERRNLEEATAYLLGTPCLRCMRLMVNSGIRKIYYLGTYNNALGKKYITQLAREAKVELKQFPFKPKELWQRAEEILHGAGGILKH